MVATMNQVSSKTDLCPAADRRLPEQYRSEIVLHVTENFSGGLRDPEFMELISQIDTGPVHSTSKVELFFDGRAAFESIYQAINAAREEILLETYILRDDSTGLEMQEALRRASARGVTVRVLADGFGSSNTKPAFWDGLREAGIEARLFHPLWTRLWDHFHRDHRKIIVIDRRITFTGGMNIADEYGSSRKAKGNLWRDTQVRLEGPIAWELAAVFREGWERAGGDRFPVSRWEISECGKAKCVVLDSRPGRGQNEISAVMSALVGASRRRLWITNAYFAPRPIAIRGLISAARRGVDVRLLLPGQSDVPIVRHAGHGFYAELLATCVRIFEYQPAILHEKSIVADDFVTIIGSSNLDFRSFQFNAECNVMLFDDSTALRMAAAFDTDLQHSVEIHPEIWARRSILHRWGDALARRLSPLL
jgi:cardiolipin synthase A/B